MSKEDKQNNDEMKKTSPKKETNRKKEAVSLTSSQDVQEKEVALSGSQPVSSAKEPKQRSSKKGFNLALICLLILVVLTAIVLIGVHFFESYTSQLKENQKEKIELKYTETNTTQPEGVYITDVSEVVENVMPSIVAITSKTRITSGTFGPGYFGKEQYAEGAGSGIIIGKTDTDILILTNNHVVSDASELSVQFINEKSYDAKIVGTSERKDVAVISVPLNAVESETLESIKIATMGDSTKLKVGNGIIAIGNALGYGQSVTTGVVSALDREVSIDEYTSKMIQIDAAINGGNSGGALLNSQGEVVGINSAKYSSSGSSSMASVEGMGFAIPISDVRSLITSLMNGEEDESPLIGVEGYIIEEDNPYDMPAGFYISKITAGSGADKSDLEIGNIITKINGKEVEELSDIQSVLYELNKGDQITLTVRYISGREYREKEVGVTLS